MKPEIELKDLLAMPVLSSAVVVKLGNRWDGVVSGHVLYEGKEHEFYWIQDEDLRDDAKEARDYAVYDESGTVIGRIDEDLVNSFRATDGNTLLWKLKEPVA